MKKIIIIILGLVVGSISVDAMILSSNEIQDIRDTVDFTVQEDLVYKANIQDKMDYNFVYEKDIDYEVEIEKIHQLYRNIFIKLGDTEEQILEDLKKGNIDAVKRMKDLSRVKTLSISK